MGLVSELAREGIRAYAYLICYGWGARQNAGPVGSAFRLSTEKPAGPVGTDDYRPCLLDPGGSITEAWDISSGEVTLGNYAVDLIDVAPLSGDGWGTGGLITDLLAARARVVREWTLSANITAAANDFFVNETPGLAGIAVGDILWIGQEAVFVTAVNVGLKRITTQRGVYSTTAAAHNASTSTPAGDGVLSDHPHFVRSRIAEIYLNVYDRDGLPVAESDAKLLYAGELTNWAQVDAARYRLTMRPIIAQLDRPIGVTAFRGMTAGPRAPNVDEDAQEEAIAQAMREDRAMSMLVIPRTPQGQAREPQTPWAAGAGEGGRDLQRFHARIGDTIAEVKYQRAAAEDAYLQMIGVRWNLRGTHGEFKGAEAPDEASYPFHEVLLTDPAAYADDSDPPDRYLLGGLRTDHVVDIALMHTVASGDWDTLPDHWQARVPVTRLDLQSFRNVKLDAAHLRMPGLVVGRDGKPFRLREWLQKHVFGPVGLVLFQTENGLIACGEFTDGYPDDGGGSIVEADILDPPGATQDGNQDHLVQTVTFRYEPDLGKGDGGGDYRRTFVVQMPAQAERHPFEPALMEIEADGLDHRQGGDQIAGSRAVLLGDIFHEPLPVIHVETGLHKLTTTLTAPVLLTVTTLGNPTTGGRGYTAAACLVIGRSLKLAEGRIAFDLMLLPNRNTCLWAPSGRVNTADAGVGTTITLDVVEHCNGATHRTIPVRDALGFVVGDVVALRTDRGVWRNVNEPTVVEVEGALGLNKIRLSDVFRDGAGLEVARATGNIIDYVHYGPPGGGQPEPTLTWTTSMKKHAAAADAANLDIGVTTSDPPKDYGV